jgi:hypothetical protein
MDVSPLPLSVVLMKYCLKKHYIILVNICRLKTIYLMCGLAIIYNIQNDLRLASYLYAHGSFLSNAEFFCSNDPGVVHRRLP